jgi:hypothetical protein
MMNMSFRCFAIIMMLAVSFFVNIVQYIDSNSKKREDMLFYLLSNYFRKNDIFGYSGVRDFMKEEYGADEICFLTPYSDYIYGKSISSSARRELNKNENNVIILFKNNNQLELLINNGKNYIIGQKSMCYYLN